MKSYILDGCMGQFFVCAYFNMPLLCKLEVYWTRGKYLSKVSTNTCSQFLRDEVVTTYITMDKFMLCCILHGDNLFVSLRLRARG